MKLHLLRHAKTQVAASSIRDFDRKLLPKGIAQSDAMGDFLKLNVGIDIPVFCSASTRTRQTLGIIQEKVPFRHAVFTDVLYHASLNTLLDFVWSVEGKTDFMIVGHNEGISELATYFTDKFISLKTCSYICIEFDADSWEETSKGLGTEVDAFRPEVKG